MKGSAMSMLGQVVEGNIITGVFDLCPGGERSREILISVMYQNGKYDVVVLDRLTRKLTRLPIKESRSAKRIGMLLNNIGNPARFVFQTSSVLELHVHVTTSLYVLVREEQHPIDGDHWIAVGEGKLL